MLMRNITLGVRLDNWIVSHFSKSISQTTTFWELGLGFFGIRVILRGKLGSYAGVRFWRKVLRRRGVQTVQILILNG